MKKKKLTPFFIPDSHKRICESGLSGQRHGRNVSDVDEMQALQAGDVLNVRRKIVRCSISLQMSIPSMPLPDQVNKVNKMSKNWNNTIETLNNTILTFRGKNR